MGEYIDRTKGKIKEIVGALADDEKLEREGVLDQAKGKVKGAAKDLKRAVQDAKSAAKDAVK